MALVEAASSADLRKMPLDMAFVIEVEADRMIPGKAFVEVAACMSILYMVVVELPLMAFEALIALFAVVSWLVDRKIPGMEIAAADKTILYKRVAVDKKNLDMMVVVVSDMILLGKEIAESDKMLLDMKIVGVDMTFPGKGTVVVGSMTYLDMGTAVAVDSSFLGMVSVVGTRPPDKETAVADMKYLDKEAVVTDSLFLGMAFALAVAESSAFHQLRQMAASEGSWNLDTLNPFAAFVVHKSLLDILDLVAAAVAVAHRNPFDMGF